MVNMFEKKPFNPRYSVPSVFINMVWVIKPIMIASMFEINDVMLFFIEFSFRILYPFYYGVHDVICIVVNSFMKW